MLELILTRRPYKRPLSCSTSVCLQRGFSYLFSGETFLAILYVLHALPQWIISLHVFEDDTVAKVTVSKANLNAFFGFFWALPRSLLLRCFALWRNANLAGGFAGRFWLWWFFVVCLSLFL